MCARPMKTGMQGTEFLTGPCAGMCDQIVPGRLHEMKIEGTNSIINEFISDFFSKKTQWSENPEKRGPNL